MIVYSVLGLLLVTVFFEPASADSHECANNFTTLDDFEYPSLLESIVTLPRNEFERINISGGPEVQFFRFEQWIFPNLNFGCERNLSNIIVLSDTSTDQPPPELFIWERREITFYMRVNMTSPDYEIVQRDGFDKIIYMFNPPLQVSGEQFIGFRFGHNGTDITSRTIAFLDLGDGNASESVHATPLVDLTIAVGEGALGIIQNFQFSPVVFAEFVDPVTDPPTTESPTTTEPLTSSTTGSTIPPPQQTVLDVGLIVGVVVAVLLLALIVLIVIIVLVVVRSRSQQKIYEVPVEPGTSNMDNPVYGGESSVPQTTELINGSHIYATPSPTISPHPPQEAQLTTSASGHYEFDEGYFPTANHYEMEPVPVGRKDDPEYAQPQVTMQPYEVPLTALQVSQRVSPSSLESSQSSNKEHIYSVLEEGIYVPTEEERKPYPYSEATILNYTPTQTDTTTIYSDMGKKYQGSLQRDGFFQQEDSYWRPASSQMALYDQLSKRKYREIVRQKIQIIKHLGSGQFGTVNLGIWQTSTESVEVAVKTLQPMASETDKVKFLQEAAIMGQFLHPNVVKLYGVVTVGEPVMIVLEYMQKGDLRNYLMSKRPQPGEMVSDDLPQTLLRFCHEISSGMNYLANKAFVHRDLAARNVLLSSESNCKIGDFGMSRDLEQSNYYITHGGKIPVKWTSPEALNFRKYSTASDVWSFGCVMYEIWSLGHKPFEGFTNLQCMQLIGSGFRLAPPPGCPKPLYELMIRCWHSDYSVRPMFSAIFNMLSHSPSHLLSWSEKDLTIHPQVACLGAPLEVTEELYPELQDYYVISDSVNGKRRNKKGSKTADW